MRRGATKSVAKLRARSQKSHDSRGNQRLAEMSARIDAARNSSYTRRPVFNKTLDVTAYELVLGDGPVTSIAVDAATRKLVLNDVVHLDFDEISDGKPIQLTVKPSFLESELPPQLGPANVTLVLGPGVDDSPSVISSLEYLHAIGYRMVLDDLVANPDLRHLARFAHAIKVNFGHEVSLSLEKQLGIMKSAGVELIADRIESYDELRGATHQGFTQFQGTFLSRPDAFRKTRAPAAQIAALELITLLQNPEADINEIAEVIRRDVSLSYRILKVVNSAQYSLQRPLGSIEEAVMLVGTKQIVEWVGMMSMSGLNDKPSELTRVAMVRARVCETLAERLGRQDVQRFHVAGLFSVIEALLDVPADKALQDLPLSTEIVDAIVSFGGTMGEVLKGIIAYEEGDWERAHIIGITDDALASAFETATIETDRAWARING